MILFEWAIKTFKQLLGNLKITYFPPSSQLGKLAVTCLGKPRHLHQLWLVLWGTYLLPKVPFFFNHLKPYLIFMAARSWLGKIPWLTLGQ